MKKFFALIFLMMSLAFSASAASSNEPANEDPIDLETRDNSGGSSRHRAPLHVNIEAFYDSMNNAINIYYSGEAEGEIFLYLNGSVVDYSTELTTSFLLSGSGLYEIEVVTDSWTAYGSIRI